jgi:small subunit ribosomal protein S8
MNDPISDFLTRIRNAAQAKLAMVAAPHSRAKESLARILKEEGYVTAYSVDGDRKKTLKLKLKYQGRKPVIAGLKRISKPGLRHYVGAREVPRVLGGLGVAILSTSRGVMAGAEARKQNLGGEVLCYVW